MDRVPRCQSALPAQPLGASDLETFPRKWVSISLSYPLHIVGTAPELVVGQGIHLDSLLNEAIEEQPTGS